MTDDTMQAQAPICAVCFDDPPLGECRTVCTKCLAAAEGERDALKKQLSEKGAGLDRLTAHMARIPSLEAERDTARADYFSLADAVCRESTGVADACRQARETRAALAEARGREKALRDVIEGAIADFNLRANTNEGKAKKASTPGASAIFSGASLAYEFAADYLKTLRARAALALPYSPQGTAGTEEGK